MTHPQTMDREAIEVRIPHSGKMCLLERLESWDAEAIHCTTSTHLQPDNPLRTAGGLMAPNAIESENTLVLDGGPGNLRQTGLS